MKCQWQMNADESNIELNLIQYRGLAQFTALTTTAAATDTTDTSIR